MGFTPQQVRQMSFWQFAMCVEGFREAHETDDAPPPHPTKADYYAAIETLH